MTTFVNVALRHYQGADPAWEAHGINYPFYGSGDTLTKARKDVREAAAALLLDEDDTHIEMLEFHEHLVRAETDTEPAVWVRTYQDGDSKRMLARRDVRDHIKDYLEKHPERMDTFTQGVGVMGDVVATVMFPDECLLHLLDQVGDGQRLYVAVPYSDGIYWQCISEEGLPDERPGGIAIDELPLSDSSTIGEFMKVTEASIDTSGNIVLSAV